MTPDRIAALYAQHDVQPSTRHITVHDLPPALQRRIGRSLARARQALLWGLQPRRRAKRWPW